MKQTNEICKRQRKKGSENIVSWQIKLNKRVKCYGKASTYDEVVHSKRKMLTHIIPAWPDITNWNTMLMFGMGWKVYFLGFLAKAEKLIRHFTSARFHGFISTIVAACITPCRFSFNQMLQSNLFTNPLSGSPANTFLILTPPFS